jgi:hypothetical protein
MNGLKSRIFGKFPSRRAGTSKLPEIPFLGNFAAIDKRPTSQTSRSRGQVIDKLCPSD